MTIESKIDNLGFEAAMKDTLKYADYKPGWGPHPWDKLAEYVAILEKRVSELESKK